MLTIVTNCFYCNSSNFIKPFTRHDAAAEDW